MTRTALTLTVLAVALSATSLAAAQEGASTAVAPDDPLAPPPPGGTESGGESVAAPGTETTEAEHGAEAAEAEAPEHAPGHLVLGVVGTGLLATAFADTLEINGSFGGGLFAEYTVVPNWLAIELDVRFLGAYEAGEFHGELPIDLLLKKPFELSEKLELYIGIGGTVVPILVTVPVGPQVLAGIASVVGGYYWLGRHFALTAELDYNLLLNAPRVIQEVGGSFGIALGI